MDERLLLRADRDERRRVDRRAVLPEGRVLGGEGGEPRLERFRVEVLPAASARGARARAARPRPRRRRRRPSGGAPATASTIRACPAGVSFGFRARNFRTSAVWAVAWTQPGPGDEPAQVLLGAEVGGRGGEEVVERLLREPRLLQVGGGEDREPDGGERPPVGRVAARLPEALLQPGLQPQAQASRGRPGERGRPCRPTARAPRSRRRPGAPGRARRGGPPPRGRGRRPTPPRERRSPSRRGRSRRPGRGRAARRRRAGRAGGRGHRRQGACPVYGRRRPGVPVSGRSASASRARARTASNIAGVSRPVFVFCRLTWYEPRSVTGPRPGTSSAASAPWPKAGAGRGIAAPASPRTRSVEAQARPPRARKTRTFGSSASSRTKNGRQRSNSSGVGRLSGGAQRTGART